MERRRRVPRIAITAEWPGNYRVEGEGQVAGACHVIDISALGAGLHILGSVTTDLVGRQIVIEVQTPAGASVAIRLAGIIRNAVERPGGGVRVGLEFEHLSETERSILKTLELMQVAW